MLVNGESQKPCGSLLSILTALNWVFMSGIKRKADRETRFPSPRFGMRHAVRVAERAASLVQSAVHPAASAGPGLDEPEPGMGSLGPCASGRTRPLSLVFRRVFK